MPARSAFSQAFFASEARAEPFLPRDFASRTARVAQVTRAAKRSVSPEALKALVAQNALYVPSAARDANLAALGHPVTAVVVTGQQAGLFLGPLYSFHKAASAIANARALEAESGVRCVPVFWLQSEDHDFAEVNTCVVLDRQGDLLELALDDGPSASSRVSVKHVLLGPSVETQLEKLKDAVGDAPFLQLLRKHYRTGTGLAQAFAHVMAEVFAAEGLVLFDPRDEAMAVLFKPVHERAIRDAAPIAEALRTRSSALEEAGFDVQVNVKAGAPLSFFHPDGPEGPRIRFEAGDVRLASASPLAFSSSALLRPVIQDSVLPTAAYVGGPGELNYFAQLAPLYSAFGLEMPMFIPRARFRLIDPRTRERLNKAGGARSTISSLPAQIQKALVDGANQALEPLAATPELSTALIRTKGTIARAASRFAARYARMLAAADSVANDRLKRLDAVLEPRGLPQERVLGLPAFACKWGLEPVKQAVFAALVPFDPEVKDVFL